MAIISFLWQFYCFNLDNGHLKAENHVSEKKSFFSVEIEKIKGGLGFPLCKFCKKNCAATVAQMEVGRQLTVWDGGRWRRPTWWSATRTQRRRRHGGGLGWQSLSIQTFWQKEH